MKISALCSISRSEHRRLSRICANKIIQSNDNMAAKMPRRPLGNTGLEVSVLGFGASPLGGVFESIDEAAGVASVHEAFRLGVNFFDTSPFYGMTKSETVLGKGLKDLPRDQIVVATKVGRYGAETFDFSEDRVTRSVHESLERLQIPYIDLIQCHDIEFGDLDQVVRETLPALQRLKQKGLVRHIGITGLPLKIFTYVLDRVPPGTVDTALSYCHHTLFDRTLQEIVPYLQDKGLGVINASPLSMGLLTPQGPPSWHPAPEEVKDLCRRAAELAASKGVDISKIAIADAVRNADIASTLVGMSSVEVVRQNVSNVLQALGLEPNDKAAAEEAALKAVGELFEPIMGTSWPSGRPENS